MSRNIRRGFVAVVVAGLIGGFTAPAALAGTAVSWWSVCAGYSGKTHYVASTGVGYSMTFASDTDKVGASLRYYGGSGPYTQRPGYAETFRAVVPYGGYHQSYCGITVTKVSSL